MQLILNFLYIFFDTVLSAFVFPAPPGLLNTAVSVAQFISYTNIYVDIPAFLSVAGYCISLHIALMVLSALLQLLWLFAVILFLILFLFGFYLLMSFWCTIFSTFNICAYCLLTYIFIFLIFLIRLFINIFIVKFIDKWTNIFNLNQIYLFIYRQIYLFYFDVLFLVHLIFIHIVYWFLFFVYFDVHKIILLSFVYIYIFLICSIFRRVGKWLYRVNLHRLRRRSESDLGRRQSPLTAVIDIIHSYKDGFILCSLLLSKLWILMLLFLLIFFLRCSSLYYLLVALYGI